MKHTPDIGFSQLSEIMISFPDIAHHAPAVAGTVWHQDDNWQTADLIRL
jgi:hypothetical protein